MCTVAAIKCPFCFKFLSFVVDKKCVVGGNRLYVKNTRQECTSCIRLPREQKREKKQWIGYETFYVDSCVAGPVGNVLDALK
jgi:hypothetical protein